MYSTLERLKIRLRQYTVETDDNGEQNLAFIKAEENFMLEELLNKAKSDIIAYRHYPTEWTEEEKEIDVENNYSNILLDLALFDYSIEGADFESNHIENGVNRTFLKRDSILAKVTPFINIL